MTARAVDQRNEVELLGDPYQRPDVAHGARPNRARRSEVGHRRRVSRAKVHLPRHRPTLLTVPHRLGGDPVPASAHLALEEVHFFM